MIALLIVALVLYTYTAVAFTQWGNHERGIDLWMIAAIMALWPVMLPVAFVFGEVRLRLKYKKYRGGRYIRKTFDANAIDEHIAKYEQPVTSPKVQ